MVVFDSKKLYSIRKERKCSQEKLAVEAGTTIRYIRDMEKGKKTNPSAVMLYRLSTALGLPMEAFMTEQEEDD